MLDYMLLRIDKDGVSSATVYTEAAFIKGILSRATEWDILATNRLKGLRLFKETEKRSVDLTPEQTLDLLAELPEHTANIVKFVIYSGFRRENILGLRIEQISFHDDDQTGEVELIVKGGKNNAFH